MLAALAKSIFGDSNDRQVKKLQGQVAAINEREAHFEAMSGDELRLQTTQLKEQIANGSQLDDVLIDAFALVEKRKTHIGSAAF